MLSAIYSSQRRGDEGFTLIELLIVVIIIGILAAIALPIFIDQQKVAIDASVKSDVRNTVTNVTNMQAQQDASAFKVAHSGGNTVEVRVEDAVVASVKGSSTVASDMSLAAPIALGTAYTVDGYNAGGKQYRGPSVTDGKAFKFTSATGQFTTEALADAAAGDGSGGGTTGGGAALPHSFSATVANASFNGGFDNSKNAVSDGRNLSLIGSAFGSDGTSETSGGQPLLNGMKPYLEDASRGYRYGSADDFKITAKNGQELTGYSGCNYSAGYLPAAWAASYGGYSGDAANFVFMQLGCTTAPAVSNAADVQKLSGATVTFKSKEGANSFKIGNISLNGPVSSTPTELNVGTTVSKTSISSATGYDGVQRTGLIAYFTKNSKSFSDNSFSVSNPDVYQYAGDGSKHTTSSLSAFNDVDVTTGFHLAYPSTVAVYDKNGNDVTSSYQLSTSIKPYSAVQPAKASNYYLYSAYYSLTFERTLTTAERNALDGGKLVIDGQQVSLSNVVSQ